MSEEAQKGDTSLRAFFDSKFGNLKDLKLILNDHPDDPGYINFWDKHSEIAMESFQ